MRLDWITWGVWAFGLSLLIYWCYKTIREFRAFFAKRRGRKPETPADRGEGY